MQPVAFNLDVVVQFVVIVVFLFAISTVVVVGLRDIWDRIRAENSKRRRG
jgi:hypothetical protein